MFGLKFLLTGLLYLTTLNVSSAANQVECAPKKPLLINVVLEQDDVRYDFSKKTAELNRIGKGAYSPHSEERFNNTEFRGLTAGKHSLNYNIKFYFRKYKGEGLACLQMHKIKVIMNYMPIIYVSTKFKKGTPIFKRTLAHEKEHVKITQRVLNKYSNILEKRLQTDLQNRFSMGPFSIDDMDQKQRELQNRVKKITIKIKREMHKDAQKQHNLFDDAELADAIKYNKGIVRKLKLSVY